MYFYIPKDADVAIMLGKANNSNIFLLGQKKHFLENPTCIYRMVHEAETGQ